MPLYEYRCKQCDRVFEVIQKFADAPLIAHEGCGGEAERLLSAPAFQFKGSGWYITDYARGGAGGGKKDGDTAKTDGKSSDSGSPASSPTSTQSKPSTPAASSKD